MTITIRGFWGAQNGDGASYTMPDPDPLNNGAFRFPGLGHPVTANESHDWGEAPVASPDSQKTGDRLIKANPQSGIWDQHEGGPFDLTTSVVVGIQGLFIVDQQGSANREFLIVDNTAMATGNGDVRTNPRAEFYLRGSDVGTLRIGALVYEPGGGGAGPTPWGTVDLATDTAYIFQLKLYKSGTLYVVRARVLNPSTGAQIDLAGTNTAYTSGTQQALRAFLGGSFTSTGKGTDWIGWWDNKVLWTSDDINDWPDFDAIRRLAPDGDGATTDWTGVPDDTNQYDDVDEVKPDNTDYIKSGTGIAASEQDFTMEAASAAGIDSDDTIIAVQVNVNEGLRSGTNGDLEVRVKDDTTTGAWTSLTWSWGLLSIAVDGLAARSHWALFRTKPSGGAWTVAALDALEVHIRRTAVGSAAADIHTSNVYAEVLYTPVAAAGFPRRFVISA